jgi:hypothetical protein
MARRNQVELCCESVALSEESGQSKMAAALAAKRRESPAPLTQF